MDTNTGTWVDSYRKDENTIIQTKVVMNERVLDESIEYTIKQQDSRFRKITRLEKVKNWLIIKLGGKLQEFYERDYEVLFPMQKEFDFWKLPYDGLTENRMNDGIFQFECNETDNNDDASQYPFDSAD